jgi:hypothetical protein
MDVDVQGCTGKMRDFLEQNMVFLLAAGVGILVLGTVTADDIYHQRPLARKCTVKFLRSATDQNFDPCCASGSHGSVINWIVYLDPDP